MRPASAKYAGFICPARPKINVSNSLQNVVQTYQQ
jgi:hypothetical protein